MSSIKPKIKKIIISTIIIIVTVIFAVWYIFTVKFADTAKEQSAYSVTVINLLSEFKINEHLN